MNVASPRWLDVGTGGAKDGWTTMDFIGYPGVDVTHDMTVMPWPFGNAVFEKVCFSHVLEHVGFEQHVRVLEEARRVLTRGGQVEVTVPDLVSCCRWFLATDEARRWGSWGETSPARWLFGQQHSGGQFHLSGFTLPRLKSVLRDADFHSIVVEVVSHAVVPIRVLVGRAQK